MTPVLLRIQSKLLKVMYIDLLDLASGGLCSPFLEWLRAQPRSQSSLVQIPTVLPTSFEIRQPLCVLL